MNMMVLQVELCIKLINVSFWMPGGVFDFSLSMSQFFQHLNPFSCSIGMLVADPMPSRI
jgi:hypothetical protein